jgi:hypothetical protein
VPPLCFPCAAQIAVTVMHLGRFYTKSQWLTAALAIQSILLVFRLQWFTQAFSAIRISYLPISEPARLALARCTVQEP